MADIFLVVSEEMNKFLLSEKKKMFLSTRQEVIKNILSNHMRKENGV